MYGREYSLSYYEIISVVITNVPSLSSISRILKIDLGYSHKVMNSTIFKKVLFKFLYMLALDSLFIHLSIILFRLPRVRYRHDVPN